MARRRHRVLAWLNIGVLVVATGLTFGFYVASAGPAALSRRVGSEAAYRTCTRYRILSAVFMTVAGANYVVYAFFPPPWSFPERFPWPYWVSVLIAVLIGIPSGIVFADGMRDAGEETMVLKESHVMYGGIYERIRHPQAAGEVWYWWVFAFLCHSPFLALYSIVWLPIFHLMSRAEERDLLIRYGDEYKGYMERTGMYFPRKTVRRA
jgi:protein-S-isoprenylcysteine O-methyltransferase Ste14